MTPTAASALPREASSRRERLVHSPSPFGPWTEFELETRMRPNGTLLVILEGELADEAVPGLATSFRRKRVRPGRQEPEIAWVQRLPPGRTSAASDARYQRLRLEWDGERYTQLERGPIFNAAAFTAAFH